jgi:integrase
MAQREIATAQRFDLALSQAVDRTPARLNDVLALKLWMDACNHAKSPHTTRAYKREAIRFRMWLEARYGDDPRLYVMAKPLDMTAYLDYLGRPNREPIPAEVMARYGLTRQPFDAQPLAVSSIRQAFAALMIMYDRFRVIEDMPGVPYVAFSPLALMDAKSVKAVHMGSARPELGNQRVISSELWLKVESYLDAQARSHTTQTPEAHVIHRKRWIVKLLYYAWLRRGEAAQLQMGHFYQRDGAWRLIVAGKGGKVKSIVALDALIKALYFYRQFNKLEPYPAVGEARPAILPQRGQGNLTGQSIYRIFGETINEVADNHPSLQEHERSLLRQASPHWMRNTGITHCADAGLELAYAASQARHEDIRLTAKTYYHPEDAAMREKLNEVIAKRRPE